MPLSKFYLIPWRHIQEKYKFDQTFPKNHNTSRYSYDLALLKYELLLRLKLIPTNYKRIN